MSYMSSLKSAVFPTQLMMKNKELLEDKSLVLENIHGRYILYIIYFFLTND